MTSTCPAGVERPQHRGVAQPRAAHGRVHDQLGELLLVRSRREWRRRSPAAAPASCRPAGASRRGSRRGPSSAPCRRRDCTPRRLAVGESVNVHGVMRIRSPSLSGTSVFGVSFTPLTNVPQRLPRSATCQRLPSWTNRACKRETFSASAGRQMSHCSCRPSVIPPSCGGSSIGCKPAPRSEPATREGP